MLQQRIRITELNAVMPKRRAFREQLLVCHERSGSVIAELDLAQQCVLEGNVPDGMDQIRMALARAQKRLGQAKWHDFARREFSQHPVRAIARQGPITRSAWLKARGYPGDAVTLDLTYGNASQMERPDLATMYVTA